MIKELQTASRVICQRLRQRPYQKGVTIKAWDAVIEQLLDGRRSWAFSWQKAVRIEVDRYITELDEETKRKIWNSSEDCKVVPNASIETITSCLYPLILPAAMRPIHRALKYRERKRQASTGANDEDGGEPW